jgi:NAD(P)-dependent dehydrogenase (short-subunit alcohol dehydrogenase family)
MGVLDGKHALITGGGTGIGAAIARALAGAGAAVSLAGRREAPLREVAAALPKAAAIVADVTSAEDCAAMVAKAREANGPIDIVVANAGAAESMPFAKMSEEHWQRMLAVNLTGSFHTVQAALFDVLRKNAEGRRIVFVASTAGLIGAPYVSAYCAAKHGVVGLMRALAAELGNTGVVTVNAVCPGYTDTPLLAAAAENINANTGRGVEEARNAMAAANDDGRLISPDDVAAKVLWLCSPDAETVNGQAITITRAS